MADDDPATTGEAAAVLVPASFEETYRACYRCLTRVAHLILGSNEVAEEIVQDAALSDGSFYCPDLDGDGRNEFVLWGSAADPDTRVADVSRERFHWDGDGLVSEGTAQEQVSYDDTDGNGVPDFREVGGDGCGDLVPDM
jgi:hypothetical protein